MREAGSGLRILRRGFIACALNDMGSIDDVLLFINALLELVAARGRG